MLGIIKSKNGVEYNSLDQVRNFLDALPNINAGGCGISAYAMYLWLKERNMLTKDFRFVFLHFGSSKDDYLHNKQVLQEEESYEKPVAPEHVGVQFNGKLIDSSGLVKIDNYNLFLDIPLEKAEDYIINSLNTNGWNSSFERPDVVKIIEGELNISFRRDMRREKKSY
jgi:hypothetical protein